MMEKKKQGSYWFARERLKKYIEQKHTYIDTEENY